MRTSLKLILSASASLFAALASGAVLSTTATVTPNDSRVVVVTAPSTAAKASPSPVLQPILQAPKVVPSSVATDVAVTPSSSSILPPLNLTDMALWNWSGRWMASEWQNANGPVPWKYNHVTQVNRGDTIFRLDAVGAPQLQALNGTPANASGFWETEVTLPRLKDGLIVAPLWVYDAASADEIDFEFAGRYGLDVSMHCKLNGVMQKRTVRLFAGMDMSNQRRRFGIKVDQTAGFVEMYLDQKLVYRWNRNAMPFFVSKPLKPWIEMWPASPTNSGFVQWAGKWPGLATGETLAMTVHGYRYTPIMK